MIKKERCIYTVMLYSMCEHSNSAFFSGGNERGRERKREREREGEREGGREGERERRGGETSRVTFLHR